MFERDWPVLSGGERLVFPSPAAFATAAAARNLACCALLRLRDGTVAFARAVGAPWTDARLDALDAALCRFDDAERRDADVARRVGRTLGLPAFTLAEVALDGVDPAWDLRRTAAVALARAVRRAPGDWDPARAGAEAQALAQRLQAPLVDAIAAFVAALDRDVCEVATRHARLDSAHYSFLAREPRRAWRLQFAQAFPILVPAAMSGARGSVGARLRAAVDTGLPLVPTLAAHWAVSPGAVRSLRGRGVAQVGAEWATRVHHLVRILDALRPEDRPRDDPEHWKRLARAVTVAETIFRCPATSSPLTLGWLRDAARHGFAHLDEARRGRRLAPEDVPMIDGLRQAMVRHLAAVMTEGPGGDDAATNAVAAIVADRRLAMLPPARLAAIARSFALEYAPRRAAREEALRRAEGWSFWPLLPRDMVAARGARRVTPLATRADIRREGVAQRLCISGGSELARALQACATGESYLLSIRDAATGQPRSTAEVRIVRRLGIGEPVLSVIQHKAQGNADPSALCVAALQEALAWAGGREGRAHLEEGRRVASEWRNAAGAALGRDDATAEALRIALGDDVHAALECAARELATARARIEH